MNWKKHYVSFKTATLVFLDPARIERLDDSKSNISGEERWQTLGKVGKLYFVVYTEMKDKKGEAIRLISARIATRAEQRSYNGHDNNSKGWTRAD
ncbi:MAG: BrnT family toxin [Treponema sp.]|nr:BrnT family toxin [Treponema sp.]